MHPLERSHAHAGREGVVVTLVMWDQELAVEQLQRRLGLRQPIIEVFSNDYLQPVWRPLDSCAFRQDRDPRRRSTIIRSPGGRAQAGIRQRKN